MRTWIVWVRSFNYWVWSTVIWAWHRVGYRVRPYDMLADRRRWFWAAPDRCGWGSDSGCDGGSR